jgi:hypothetical protein
MRVTPYVSPCTFTSRVFDAGQPVNWDSLAWTGSVPGGTSLNLSVRTGNTPTPDGTWTAFSSVAQSGDPIGKTSRYLQYQADLTTVSPTQTPVLSDVTIRYVIPTPPTAVSVSAFTAAYQSNAAHLEWQTANETNLVGFNVYRSATENGVKQKLNANLIPTQNAGQMIGSSYQLVDPVSSGSHYFYWLEAIDLNNHSQFYQTELFASYQLFLPITIK